MAALGVPVGEERLPGQGHAQARHHDGPVRVAAVHLRVALADLEAAAASGERRAAAVVVVSGGE